MKAGCYRASSIESVNLNSKMLIHDIPRCHLDAQWFDTLITNSIVPVRVVRNFFMSHYSHLCVICMSF